MQRLGSQRQSADGVLVLSTINPCLWRREMWEQRASASPALGLHSQFPVPGATTPLSSGWLSRTHPGASQWSGGRQLLCCQNRAEWSWPGNGRGGDQKAHLAARRTHILTDVGCPSQSLAALGGQGLSFTPAGRHRLAGQRAWPMNPAKKVGNKDPGGKQG